MIKHYNEKNLIQRQLNAMKYLARVNPQKYKMEFTSQGHTLTARDVILSGRIDTTVYIAGWPFGIPGCSIIKDGWF